MGIITPYFQLYFTKFPLAIRKKMIQYIFLHNLRANLPMLRTNFPLLTTFLTFCTKKERTKYIYKWQGIVAKLIYVPENRTMPVVRTEKPSKLHRTK